MNNLQTEPRILYRQGIETDRHSIQALMASFDMEADLDPAEFLIAQVNTTLIGAVRKERIDHFDFIRPIVVAKEWQKQGVGARLINEIRMDLQQIAVVARGQALGFYTRLGFFTSDWDWLPGDLIQECKSCPDNQACAPVVMVWKRC